MKWKSFKITIGVLKDNAIRLHVFPTKIVVNKLSFSANGLFGPMPPLSLLLLPVQFIHFMIYKRQNLHNKSTSLGKLGQTHIYTIHPVEPHRRKATFFFIYLTWHIAWVTLTKAEQTKPKRTKKKHFKIKALILLCL